MLSFSGHFINQVFSAANSVIPEIGAIKDWDNVAIVMKFPSSTLAQVKSSTTLVRVPDPLPQEMGQGTNVFKSGEFFFSSSHSKKICY